MRSTKLEKAVAEARRFLSAYDAMIKRLEEIREATNAAEVVADDYLWGYTKYSSAIRRASMDLTRALAEMRKP